MEQIRQIKQFQFYDFYAEILSGLNDESAGRIARLMCEYMFTDYAVAEIKDDKERFYWGNIVDVLQESKENELNGKQSTGLNRKMKHFTFQDNFYDAIKLLDDKQSGQYVKELVEELPKDKPLWYASKEMKPYRYTIDLIADFVIETNPEASKANEAFRNELREKQERLQEKMGGWYQAQAESELDRVQNLKGYEEVVVSNKSLHTVEALEWDYRRRIGNIVLHHVRDLQKETFQRGKRTYYKTNDKRLKCGIRISERKIKRLNDKFFSAVIDTFLPETRSYHNRLNEIEEELEEKKKQEEWQNEQEELKRSKYYWSK